LYTCQAIRASEHMFDAARSAAIAKASTSVVDTR
jgi:hypothetical protein